MAIYQEFETDKDGEEFKLLNHLNTDDIERLNWETAQENGKGFIRDAKGGVSGRLVANIPVEEAAMLEHNKDIDWLSFKLNHDRAAFRRLLKRFPYWQCCEGSV